MTFKTYTTKALNAANNYAEAIDGLRKLCAKLDRDAARAEMLPIVAAFYKVPVVDGERKAAGTKVLDKDAPRYLAAKMALQRLLADIYGKPEAAPAPKQRRVSKDVRAAAEAYLANFESVAEAIAVLRAVAGK